MRLQSPVRQAGIGPSPAHFSRVESCLRTLLSCVGAAPTDPRRGAVPAAVDELLGCDPAVVYEALHRLAVGPAPTSVLRDRYRLTRREVDVAHLLALGHSNSEIAATLSISEHTCRHHTERVLTKLELRSRAGVAARLRGFAETA